MSHPGQKNLMTDVAGLRVGNAHDETVLTGATAILCDSPFGCWRRSRWRRPRHA